MTRRISNSVALADGDNDLVVIPGNMVGMLKRLAVHNPTAADRTIIVRDSFTPSASAGVPAPVTVSPDRYRLVVRAGDWVDLSNEQGISRHLGILRVNSDAAGPVFSYMLELS